MAISPIASTSISRSKERVVRELECRGVETLEDEWGPLIVFYEANRPGQLAINGETAVEVLKIVLDKSNDVLVVDLPDAAIRLEFLSEVAEFGDALAEVFPNILNGDLGENSSRRPRRTVLSEVSGLSVDSGADHLENQTFMAGCVMRGDDGSTYVLSFQVEDWVLASPPPDGYKGEQAGPCFVIDDEVYYSEVESVEVRPEFVEVRLVGVARSKIVIRKGDDGFEEFCAGVIKVCNLAGWSSP